MARFWPAAVRSRIQSPSLISQVTMQPASGLPCSIEAVMASVSSTSILSRLSLDQTFQARFAIGIAFQSISGMLTATTTGLALKAISSDSVGSASGERADSTDAPAWPAPLRRRRSAERLDVGEACALDPLEQQPKHRLLRRVIFQHEARAVVIDPRGADAGLGFEPGQEVLGDAAVAAKRGDVEPDRVPASNV